MKPVNLQGHSRPIKKVKFNENGQLLYTASSDRTIISWSIPKGEKVKTYTHSAAINTFCITNKYLISGDNTGTIYIWDIPTEKILKKLEHDPTFSVRSLDFLQSDQSQIMIVYAGRGKSSKSFISIYNINDILSYGELKKEDKKEEENLSTISTIESSKSNENTLNNQINMNYLTASNVASTTTSSNNNNIIKKPYQERSIYDDENSIYSIYAKNPKPSNTQNNTSYNNYNNFSNQMNSGNYNFANNNNQSQPGNFNNNNNYRFSNQNYKGNSLYNFDNNNNNIGTNNNNNQNSNYVFNSNPNNMRMGNMNNNFNRNMMQNQNSGSFYNINNNNPNSNYQMNNNNNSFYNKNLNNLNNNTNNCFNPNKGNNYDPNPSSFSQIDNNSKIIVSYEKVIPMKQIESPTNAVTKYVIAKFFPYNNSICIAVTKENGYIEFINYVSTKTIHEDKLHEEIIFDFDFDVEKNIFLSVSKDGTATVYDFEKYSILKKFKPDNPIRFLNTCIIYKNNKTANKNKDENNSQSKNDEKVLKLDADKIFEINLEKQFDLIKLENESNFSSKEYDYSEDLIFVVAGGQDSKLVTTTKEGGFEILGYVLDEEKPIFSHLANFGPVNTIDLNRHNNYFASGAEDSTVKLLNVNYLLSCNVNQNQNIK